LLPILFALFAKARAWFTLKNHTGSAFFVKEPAKTLLGQGLPVLFVAVKDTTPKQEMKHVINVMAPAGRPTDYPAHGAKEKDSQKGLTYDARIKYGFKTKPFARFC
jgi:hypothetical protein